MLVSWTHIQYPHILDLESIQTCHICVHQDFGSVSTMTRPKLEVSATRNPPKSRPTMQTECSAIVTRKDNRMWTAMWDCFLHQRTQYCGWHIDHSDQHHQTFVEIAHSRLFSQQLDPSWCHGIIYYRNARCTIYCVFDIRPNRTQFLWDNSTFETTANANTEVRYKLLDNLAVQQQHQPPIIVLLSLSLCDSTSFCSSDRHVGE
jgi:hypothetical protein